MSMTLFAAYILYANFSYLHILIGGGFLSLVLSLIASRFEVLDPRFWFSGSLFLYSFAAPILSVFGENDMNHPEHSTFVLYIGFTAGVLAVNAISVAGEPRASGATRRVVPSKRELAAKQTVARVSVMVFTFMSAANVVQFIRSGAQTKREFWFVDVSLYIDVSYNYMILSYTFYIVLSLMRTDRFPRLIGAMVFFVSFFAAVFTGERDVLLKFTLCTAMALSASGRLGGGRTFVLSMMVFLVLPFLKPAMNLAYGLPVQIELGALFFSILRSDFQAAGQNLDILLIAPQMYEGIGWERFVSDIVRGLLPGSFFSGENTNGWFVSDYAPKVINRTSPGLGFTLVGTFYVYAGLAGVIFGFSILGVLLCVMFRMASSNEMILVAYIVVTPLLIWSLRGDVSYVLSSITKQVVFPLILMVVTARICRDISFQVFRKAPV